MGKSSAKSLKRKRRALGKSLAAPSPVDDDVVRQGLARQAYKVTHRLAWHSKLIDAALGLFDSRLAIARKVRRSPLFDTVYYLTQNPDVASSGMDAAQHYASFGDPEARDPNMLLSHEAMRAAIPPLPAGANLMLAYEAWLAAQHAKQSDPAAKVASRDNEAIARHIQSLTTRPRIAVVMPVYNPDHKFLKRAIASVQRQLYDNWELCIADDASTDRQVVPLLQSLAAIDPRIKLVRRPKNGHIAAATNSALALVKADFVAFMDQDDLLHETALYEIAVASMQNPDARLIYSDHDIINAKDRRAEPYFKPDFNIELLLGQNFINHLTVVETKLLRKLGGLRSGFEGSQDYDLLLRILREIRPEQIVHIPAVLYHWRRGTGVRSFSERRQQECAAAARAAIQEYLDWQGEGAKVVALDHPKLNTFHRVIRSLAKREPKVSAIIPTRNKPKLLETCVEGLLTKTDYNNLEIIIVDNDSDELEALALLKHYAENPRIRVLPYRGKFNYSAINNAAVREAKGKFVLLLNNDIEVIHPDWLKVMVTEAARKGVGAVGAKLFYPNGKLQHAGVITGIGGIAGHALHAGPGQSLGYFGSTFLTRAFSAITAACLVVERKKYLQVGGLDEKNLPVAFNDVDFCLRLVEAGYRNVWTPFARLVHHESLSRGSEDTIQKQIRSRAERRYMEKRWRGVLTHDPFYNPNLTLDNAGYGVVPTRRPKPWEAFL